MSERARAGKVQLPENFNLGFDEYATSLPNSVAAPRLGRQLKAIEWLANRMIEAHVDSLSSLTRSALPEEKAAATPDPASGQKPRQHGLPSRGARCQDRRLDFRQPRLHRQSGGRAQGVESGHERARSSSTSSAPCR